MIIVTGTKRSGTSMWMQLLHAAGFPSIGSEFPGNWEKTLKDANPAGFYESALRHGIYYETNPHPKTGAYLFPEQTQRHAVKVFIPGLIRTDRVFIDSVVATVRPWRQYVRSLERLHAIEHEANEEARKKMPDVPPPAYLPPALEWWIENFSLVSDLVTRRYRMYMVAYDSVLEDPEGTLRAVFEWLDDGDVEKAVESVDPQLRTQHKEESSQDFGIDSEAQSVFDGLYRIVKEKKPLTQAFVDELNETNERLEPQLKAATKRVAEANQTRQRVLAELLKNAPEPQSSGKAA